MFKVGRWRNEKIKVVFRLHFQVTQVPCSKSRLMISLVPVDVGQPTVRLGKEEIQDGICTWDNPVYESVKFSRETKSGKLHDKFYHFIISTGSSKAGFLGEVSVNLAAYVEATTPAKVSLPIKSSNSGAILHITIQNTRGEDDQRGIEENSLHTQLSNSQSDRDDEYRSSVASPGDDCRKKPVNGNSLNSLLEQKDNRIHQDMCEDQSHSERIPKSAAVNEVKREHQSIDSLLNWSSDEEFESYEESTVENLPTEQQQELREEEREPPISLIDQLKREIFGLKRQAEVSDIELQSLRRQVVKETKRGQELSRQVATLKEGRHAFKAESVALPNETESQSNESQNRLNEAKQELKHAKDMNRALRSRLSKTQDSNSELILVVRGLEEKLDKNDKKLAILHSKLKSNGKDKEFDDEGSELVNDNREHETPTPNADEVQLFREQIEDLQGELERHVKEKRELEHQIEQLSQDYEISKKENNNLSSKFNQKQLELIKKEKEYTNNFRTVEELESQIARLENVIEKQAEEYSESSCSIVNLERQVKRLEQELEQQTEEFEEEIQAMSNAKVEEEQRALQAEENMRKAKLDNAVAAQRLQDEFSKLSEELTSKFKENEELTLQTDVETRELHRHISVLEEDLEKAGIEVSLVHDQCKSEVQKLLKLVAEKENELEELSLAHKDENEELRRTKKKAQETCEALSNENQALRMEVERLTEENYYFSSQLEEMTTTIDEIKTALEETKRERDDLEKIYDSVKTEVQQSQEELKALRSLKEKQDAMAGVQSDMETLQAHHNQLKLENENFKKQLSRQKENLQKKDQELAQLEKLKNSGAKEVSTLKEKIKQLKAIRPAGISPENNNKVEERKSVGKKMPHSEVSSKPLQNGANRASGESKRETGAEKKAVESRTNDLLREIEILKEKHKYTEDELQEMQEKYSDVSLKFAEVEGERQQLVMTIRNLKNGQKK